MRFTVDQFRAIFPANQKPDLWIPAFEVLPDFGVHSTEQVAAFCSQVGHESLDMTILEENLNYSAEGLLKVFPKYFRDVSATDYARKPEKIANRVYANRMGNANEELGDGWKFRGRGLIMLTGYDNYYDCSLDLYGDATILVDDPDLVAKDPIVAIKTALWFWKKNGLQNLDDIVAI
jgi:putative chitinase